MTIMNTLLATRTRLTAAGIAAPRWMAARSVVSTPVARNSGTTGAGSSAGEMKITDILTKKFSPNTLKVQDVSGGCGSFYAIEMSSKLFNGLTPLKAHKLVTQELKDVIKDIHGLQLKTAAEE